MWPIKTVENDGRELAREEIAFSLTIPQISNKHMKNRLNKKKKKTTQLKKNLNR